MTFFNKKEDVIDIQLTQFGKDLLSRGFFKPVYYQFFDDDILYDSTCAGFSEHQNDTETRILEDTPRLRTQHLTTPVSERYAYEEEQIQNYEAKRFKPIKKNLIPEIQEKILMYPIGSKDVKEQLYPRFNIVSYGSPFSEVRFSSLTSSGIPTRDPIIEAPATYTLKEDRSDLREPRMINEETFIDVNSKDLVFADNSKISLNYEKLIVDIQELGAFTGIDNFEFSIHEIVTDVASGKEVKKKIKTLEEINKLFSIKTDEDVTEINVKDIEGSNGYKRGEN